MGPALIAEGHALVRACLRRNQPGPYQIQAAINAVHTDARRAADTDWGQIVALYDQLLAVRPDAGRRAQPRRRARRGGRRRRPRSPPSTASTSTATTSTTRRVPTCWRGSGASDEAAAAYDAAIGLTGNAAERDHLQRKRAALGEAPHTTP